jgi:hypothetical protein
VAQAAASLDGLPPDACSAAWALGFRGHTVDDARVGRRGAYVRRMISTHDRRRDDRPDPARVPAGLATSDPGCGAEGSRAEGQGQASGPRHPADRGDRPANQDRLLTPFAPDPLCSL